MFLLELVFISFMTNRTDSSDLLDNFQWICIKYFVNIVRHFFLWANKTSNKWCNSFSLLILVLLFQNTTYKFNKDVNASSCFSVPLLSFTILLGFINFNDYEMQISLNIKKIMLIQQNTCPRPLSFTISSITNLSWSTNN